MEPTDSLKNSVDEYQDFLNRTSNDKSLSLQDFAMMQDAVEGTNKRAGVYTPKPTPGVLQQLGQFLQPIQQGWQGLSKAAARMPFIPTTPTGAVTPGLEDFAQQEIQKFMGVGGNVPTTSLAGAVTPAVGALGESVGLDRQASEQVGQQMAEGAPLMAAQMATGVGPMALMQGLGSSIDAAARGDSLASVQAQGAAGAAMPLFFEAGGKAAQELAAQGMAKLGVQNPVMQQLGEYLGQQTGMMGAGLAHGGAMQAARGEMPDQYSKENVFSTIVNQAPWAVKGLMDVASPPPVTRTGQVVAADAAQAEGERQWGSELGQQVKNLVGDVGKPDFAKRVRAYAETLSPDEYQKLSPLFAEYPQMPANAPEKDALEQFRQVLAGELIQKSAMEDWINSSVKNHPDVVRAWKDYRELLEEEPDNKAAQANLVAKIDATEKRIRSTVEQGYADELLTDESGRPLRLYHGSREEVEGGLRASPVFGSLSMTVNPEVSDTYALAGRRSSVFPLFARKGKYFDYENPEHVADLMSAGPKQGQHSLNGVLDEDLVDSETGEVVPDAMEQMIRRGDYRPIEDNIPLLRALGYEGYWTSEHNTRNLHVLDPRQKIVYPYAAGIQFSLLDPSRGLDFSDPQKLDSNQIFDQLMNGRLVPTGVPGNEANLQFVDQLKRTLLKPTPDGNGFARNYEKEKELLRLGALVGEAGGPEQLSAEAKERWGKLSSDEKILALKLTRVWQDPAKELGFVQTEPQQVAAQPNEIVATGVETPKWGENIAKSLNKAKTETSPSFEFAAKPKSMLGDRWTFTQGPLMRPDIEAIRQKAYDALRTGTRDYQPINDPADLGQLVKTGNEYVDAVVAFANQNKWGQKEIFDEYGQPLQRLDEEQIKRMYREELEKSGALYSQPEAISRVVEAVKARILYARSIAEGIAQKASMSEDFTKRNQVDMANDKEFTSKLQTLPRWVQDIVGLHYGKASEYADVGGRRQWRLDAFRKEVGDAISSLTPEDIQRLEAAKPGLEFNPSEYTNLMKRRAALGEKPRRVRSDDEEGEFVNVDPSEKKRALEQLTGDDEEAMKGELGEDDSVDVPEEREKATFGPSEMEALRKNTEYLTEAQKPLESTKVKYDKEGKTVGDNLWNVLTKEHPYSSVETASERTEIATDKLPEVMQETPEEAAQKSDIANDLVQRFFKPTDKEPMDPQSSLQKLTNDQFAVIYSSLFKLRPKIAKLAKGDIGNAYKTGARDNSDATSQMLREILDADMQADVEKSADGQRQITEAQKNVIEKVTGKPYAEWRAENPKLRWNDFILNNFGDGNRTSTFAKLEALKLQLSGMELKDGVKLSDLNEAYTKKLEAKKQAKLEYSVENGLRTAAYKFGLSPEWVDTMMPTLKRAVALATPLSDLSFAEVVKPEEVFKKAVQTATNLGVYIPINARVGGQYVRDPIIGLHIENLIKKFPSTAMSQFMITSTLAHESLHAFVEGVVKKPENEWPLHVKAQVRQYLNLLDRVHSLTPEDRVALVTSTLDTMIPPEFLRSVGPDGLSRLNPDIQGLIRGVVNDPEEIAAFLYQHATAGMLMDSNAKTVSKAIQSTKDRLLWMDDDVREFIRGRWRDLNDLASTVQDVINDKNYRASRKMGTQIGIETSPPRREGMLRSEVEAAPEVTGKTRIPSEPTPLGLEAGQRVMEGAAGGSNSEPGSQLPLSFEERRNAQQAIEAAGRLAMLGQAPSEFRNVTNFKVLRELIRLDKRLAATQAQIDRIHSFYNGDASIREIAMDGKVQTVNEADLSDAQQSRILGDVPLGDAKKAKDGVNLAAKWLGKDGEEGKYTQGVLTRYMALMPQRLQAAAREGFQVAADAVNTLNWQPLATKLIDSIYAPVTRRTPSGEVKFDEETPFRRLFQQEAGSELAPAKLATNAIIRELQTLNVGTGEKDNSMDSPEGQKVVARHLQNVPKEQRPLVIEAARTIFNMNRDVLAKAVLPTARSTQAGIAGQFLMVANAGKLTAADAERLGYQILNLATMAPKEDALPAQKLAYQTQLNELVSRAVGAGLDPQSVTRAIEVVKPALPQLQRMQMLATGDQAFASEQRFGRYMVAWTDAKGERHNVGFDKDTDAKYFVRDLAKKGMQNLRADDTYKWSDQARMAYDYIMLNGVDQELTNAFQKQLEMVAQLTSVNDVPNEQTVGQKAADLIRKNFDPMQIIYEHSSLSQLDKNWMQREFKPGREYIDYFANTVNYVNKTALAASRQASRNKLALQTLELRQKGANELADDLLKHFNETISPEAPTVRTWRAFVASMSLAGNIPNALLESFQPIQSGLQVLTRQTNSTKSAAEAMANATGALTQYALNSGSFQKVVDSADMKVRKGEQMTKEEEIAYHYRRMLDEGRLSGKLYLEDLDQTVKNVNIAKPRLGDMDLVDRAKVLTDSALGTMVHALEIASVAREKMTGWNQRLTSYSALEAGYQMGLRGDKLFSFAAGLVPSMNLIGGRYIRPYGATVMTQGNPIARNMFGSFYVMQNYAIGFTSQLMKDAHDGFSVQESRLKPEQRAAARQAFAQGMAVTVALAGIGGLPLVRAAFAMIQKLTGKDPEQALQEGLYKAGTTISGDRKIGQLVSDLAMNGAVNRFSGVDFASRAGVESIFGLSPDEGFSPSDLAGPSANMVGNLISATQLLAHGQVGKAALKVAPGGLKGATRAANSLYNYGDLRTTDAAGNLTSKPEGLQKLGFVLGFGTAQQAQMNREAQLIHRSEEWSQQQKQFEYNGYAQELLKGNSWAIMQKAYQHQYDPDFNPKEFISAIVDRAINMTTPRDAQQTGALGTSPQRAALGATFDNPRESAVVDLQKKAQLLAALGYPFGMKPPTAQDMQKAQMIDQLVQYRGFTRQEAEQIVARQLPY